MDRMQRMLLDRAAEAAPRAQAILEVGCGSGTFLYEASLRFPQAQIVGVDIAEDAVALAAKRLGARIQVVRADVGQLPFHGGAFDLVFAFRTLHHWDNKQQGLLEVSRVLKQGGLFLLGDALAEGVWGEALVKRLAEQIDGGVFVSGAELGSLLSAAGLEVVGREVVPGSAKAFFATVASKG